MRAKSDEVKKRDSKRRGAGDSDVEKCFENFYCSGNVVAVVVQWLRSVQLFVNPWTATQQTSPPFTISRSLLKLISIESVMSCNHLILCCSNLLLPSVFPSIKVLSNELAPLIRWPEYWSYSFSISPSDEYSGLISLRMYWFYPLVVQETLKSILHTTIGKHQFFSTESFLWSNSHICT